MTSKTNSKYVTPAGLLFDITFNMLKYSAIVKPDELN